MRLSKMINAIDLHAAGQHARVIVGGVHNIRGATVYEKMQYLRDHRDDLRRRMLREPRGFPTANCNLLVPATHPDADIGFVIMEQVEYPLIRRNRCSDIHPYHALQQSGDVECRYVRRTGCAAL